MKKLVRGASVLSVLSLCFVFIYAQTGTGSTLDIATDSQLTIQNNISDTNLVNNTYTQHKPAAVPTPVTVNANVAVVQDNTNSDARQDGEVRKLVKKTASVKATASGVSRGSFSATAYCLKGKTAMGHRVRRGIIAADPRVLKLGSEITIASGPYSGTYLVSDTGGKVKGKRLDIWMPSCSEARRFGRRSVQVFSGQ